jgi:hypothetical protein
VITADTITDEQIRELRLLLREEHIYERWPDGAGSMRSVTDLALQHCEHVAVRMIAASRKESWASLAAPAIVRSARARCAEILNARSGK